MELISSLPRSRGDMVPEGLLVRVAPEGFLVRALCLRGY